METKLRFSRGNAKLAEDIYTFSLPAGHACPGALRCMAKADQITGKLQDGPSQSFRCFAAGDESRYPNVRRIRWHNFNLLKGQTREGMEALILDSTFPIWRAIFFRIRILQSESSVCFSFIIRQWPE